MATELKKTLPVSLSIISLLILFSMFSVTRIIPPDDLKDLLNLNFNTGLFGILSIEIYITTLIWPFCGLSGFCLFPLALATTLGFAFVPKPQKFTNQTFLMLLTPSIYPIFISSFLGYLSVKSTDDMFIFPEGSWPYQVLTALFISCIAWCLALWSHFKLNSSDKELKWFVFLIVSAQAILTLQFFIVSILGRIPHLHW